jgi:two-component system phosphate regulon response regulator PhoB
MHDMPQFPPSAPHKTVLVVVEEPAVRELISASLRHAGFVPMQAASAQDGRRLVGEVRPDVIVIDMDSPATADASFALALSAADPSRPVSTVMVTADPGRTCGPDGPACGASLCVAKPFSPRELVGLITQHLRPAPPPRQPVQRSARKQLQVGPLELDTERLRLAVRRDGRTQTIDLAPVEVKLLHWLMQHPDLTQGREQIVAAVWGEGSWVEPRTVDQNVKRLRRCLQEVGAGDLVKTVRGVGYRLDSTPSRTAPRGR